MWRSVSRCIHRHRLWKLQHRLHGRHDVANRDSLPPVLSRYHCLSSRFLHLPALCDKHDYGCRSYSKGADMEEFSDEAMKEVVQEFNDHFAESIDRELVEIELRQKQASIVAERAAGPYYYYDSEQVSPVDAELAHENAIDHELTSLRHKRGEMGVFDIGDLVYFLRQQRGDDLCVIRLPPEMNYVDYIVIVTAVSVRHVRALRGSLVSEHKLRRAPGDGFLIPSGTRNDSWMTVALGAGRILLHVMTREERERYDLESLWTVGHRYDSLCVERADESSSTVQDAVLDKYAHLISDELRDKLRGGGGQH